MQLSVTEVAQLLVDVSTALSFGSTHFEVEDLFLSTLKFRALLIQAVSLGYPVVQCVTVLRSCYIVAEAQTNIFPTGQ